MKILILYVAERVVVNCISSTLTWHISQLIRALVWSWWEIPLLDSLSCMKDEA